MSRQINQAGQDIVHYERPFQSSPSAVDIGRLHKSSHAKMFHDIDPTPTPNSLPRLDSNHWHTLPIDCGAIEIMAVSVDSESKQIVTARLLDGAGSGNIRKYLQAALEDVQLLLVDGSMHLNNPKRHSAAMALELKARTATLKLGFDAGGYQPIPRCKTNG